jgi:hypothetical protein
VTLLGIVRLILLIIYTVNTDSILIVKKKNLEVLMDPQVFSIPEYVRLGFEMASVCLWMDGRTEGQADRGMNVPLSSA